MPWRRAWQTTPVFLPGECHEQRIRGPTVHGVTKSQTQLKRLRTQAKYIILLPFHHMTKMNLLAILQSSFSHSLLSLLLLNTVSSKDHALKLPPGWLKASHIEYWTFFCFLSFYYLLIYLTVLALSYGMGDL